MSEKLRVGILGAGWAGSSHAAAFSRLPDVQVSALWSRTRSTAETLAAQLNEPNLQVYDDWRNLIESAEVHIISLATPPTMRIEPLVMALDYGRHVLVEKPLTVRLNGAEEIRDTASRADVVTAVSFNWRYAPGNLVAKKAIAEGRIGKILDISAIWRVNWLTREFIEQRPWMKDFSMSDGSLGEGMSHDLDRVRFLTGIDFKRVVSKLVSRPLPTAQEMELAGGNSFLLSELADGIIADIQLVLMAGFPEWGQVISGQTGTLNVTHEATSLQNIGENEVVLLQPSDSEKAPEGADLLQHTWNRLIADFVSAIRSGDKALETVPNLPTLEDGLKVQQVISAAHLSDTEARWVDLDEFAS